MAQPEAGTRPFSLDGQVVVVTGAGRGIGRAIALAVAAAGGAVAAGSRSPGELASLAAEIKAGGTPCWWQSLDVTSTGSMRDFLAGVTARFGRLDGLVNNAGDNIAGPALDVTEEQFDHLVAVNFKSVFFLSQLAARIMREPRPGQHGSSQHGASQHGASQHGGGAIVSITSQAALVGAPGRAPYSGAKAAVTNLTRTLAAEWAPDGIRVNAVAPTFTRTKLAESVLAANAELRATVQRNILLGRVAEPQEIAWPAVFLLSPAAAMITGHTLVVDGGWTIT